MSILEIKSVTKEYSVRDVKIAAIDDLDLKIEEQEFLIVLGKSGSGKSTLLSLLSGLEQPTKGQITYKDQNLGSLTENELARIRRNEIGIIFQHFYLMESMTAIDNVELPLLIAKQPLKERREWALKLLKVVGLDHRAAHYPNELSGGERQRTGIARALANRAKLIIADEPTGDLDSKTGREIIDLLHRLNQGNYPELDWKPTIILVTHDMGLVKAGMRVITLSDGKIIEDQVMEEKT